MNQVDKTLEKCIQITKCPEFEIRLTVRMPCVGKFEVQGGEEGLMGSVLVASRQ